jgi:hypothetical protein
MEKEKERQEVIDNLKLCIGKDEYADKVTNLIDEQTAGLIHEAYNKGIGEYILKYSATLEQLKATEARLNKIALAFTEKSLLECECKCNS